MGSSSVSKGGGTEKTFDQRFVDTKVKGFETQGNVSGTRSTGDAPDGGAEVSPEIQAYRKKQNTQWQARKDAEARDKLFGQSSSGRVNGQEVEPFSATKFEENAEGLVKADKAAKAKAPPPAIKTILKTAAITTAINAPITGVTLVVVEALKPVVNPLHPAVTTQSIQEGRLVDLTEKNVFQLVNTLGSLRDEEHVKPSVKWVAQTNDERLDSLENMLDYAEGEFANEAKKRGISFQPASTGAPKEDIKSRVIAMEKRLAALSALMADLKVKLSAS